MAVISQSFDDSQDAFAEEIRVSRTHSRPGGSHFALSPGLREHRSDADGRLRESSGSHLR